MEHAIRHEISIRVEVNPSFYQSLRERLEAIIEQRRQERIDAAEQLMLFAEVREDTRSEQTQAQDIGLDARGFAIYGLLQKQRPSEMKESPVPYNAANRDLAALLDQKVEPFTSLVDWWQKDDLQREIRRTIKQHLRARGNHRGRDRSTRRRHRRSRQAAGLPLTATETSAVTWGKTRISYAICRSHRRKKTVAVTVDPAGTVLLVAPEHFPASRLDAFVRQKAPWIVQRLRHVQSCDPPPAPREFVSGESVLYLGRHYRLKVHPGGAGDAKLRGAWLHVPAPDGTQQTAHVRTALVAWFRRHAADRLPERVQVWRSKVDFAPPASSLRTSSRSAGGVATGAGPSA